MDSISEKELLRREIYVNSLQKYHVKFKSNLASILQRFEWTSQHILDQQSPKVTCSYCPDHKMPAESLKKHEEICYLVREKGYTIEELEKEAPSSRFFYENSKIMSITLEKDVINGILDRHRRRAGRFELKSPTTGDRDVPQTLAASKIDFSPSERLVLYDSVVKLAKESKQTPAMPEDKLLTMDLEALVNISGNSNEADEPSSEAEKWAAMRDYKRRRQSYRAKNVHITKKAYTEIIREVIHNQVDLLQKMKRDEKLETEKKAHKRKSDSKNETVSNLKNRDRESPECKKRDTDKSYSKNETVSNLKNRDRESPERKKRDTDKSDSRNRDQKNPDDRRRERDHNNSPDSRKRDRRSPESKDRRSRRESPRRTRRESPRRGRRESPRRSRRESPNQKRRSRSSPYSRKKDHKSPDARKREKEEDEVRRRSAKLYFDEPWKKYDGENPEGVDAVWYSKSRDHKKRSDYTDQKRSRGDNQEFKMFQAKVDNIVDALVNFH